jgi:hypothetical protein
LHPLYRTIWQNFEANQLGTLMRVQRRFYQPVSSTFVALHPAAPNVPLKSRDFLPIGFVSENPMFIATSPSLGIKTR